MQNILIFGENSYIGNSFEAFARDKFSIKKISSRGNAWQSADFSGFDCALYCAGTVHMKNADSGAYFAVNCDLAIETAEKAKAEGVKHFIYLSSASVYGKYSGMIDCGTAPNPVEPYGQSKLKAEQELNKLKSDAFIVTIIRPPMVYGAGCKGNFQSLLKLARLCPVFPDINNKRSMIYIENLCCFFVWAVENRQEGIFFPQNAEYINTTELYKAIRQHLNKKTRATKFFNPLIDLFSRRVPALGKLFGDFAYAGSECENIGCVGFEESVGRSIF